MGYPLDSMSSLTPERPQVVSKLDLRTLALSRIVDVLLCNSDEFGFTQLPSAIGVDVALCCGRSERLGIQARRNRDGHAGIEKTKMLMGSERVVDVTVVLGHENRISHVETRTSNSPPSCMSYRVGK
jgi:hypothetical protein